MHGAVTDLDIETFTEEGYRQIVVTAAQSYRFLSFPEALDAEQGGVNLAIWRHDVDMSPHRALRLAEIEAELGVSSTFFFLFHSEFYNLLEGSIVRLVERIFKLGHRPGLHFDLSFRGPYDSQESLSDDIAAEAALFGRVFGFAPEAVSFHNPDVGNALSFTQARLAGLVNTYCQQLRDSFSYVSDSNGYWRFQNLRTAISEASVPRLHVLTHPEWWVERPMRPRERISRAIDGRAKWVHAFYDAALASMGRVNVR